MNGKKIRAKNWSLLVKPTEECNLNCKYCYAKPFRDKYGSTKMTFETIDKILTLCEENAEEVNWIWHGGEPTMMGIEWYTQVQELFYKHYKTKFNQSMQSNGVLLNEEWSKLSQKYGISIGVSYDVFNQDIRVGSDNVNLEDNIKKFIGAGGSLGTITVINRSNYKKQIELYDYFKENFGFDPAFNHVYRTDGTLNFDLEVTADEYSAEFIKLYKHWLNDTSLKAISERSVSTMTQQVMGGRRLVCTYSDCRQCWIGVNCVGDIYPCDRFVPEKYSMGNIADYTSITDIYKANGHKLYSMEIQKRFLTHCKDCGYFDYCKGGCNANHIAVNGDATGIDSFSCDLFKKEFNGVYEALREIDIYNNKYNFHIYRTLIEEPFFTVKEIKDFLISKDITVNENPNLNGKEILNSKEFRLMRLFNPFKGDINGHINYRQTAMSVNVNYDDKFNMNDLKPVRIKCLNEIYDISIEKIWEILKE